MFNMYKYIILFRFCSGLVLFLFKKKRKHPTQELKMASSTLSSASYTKINMAAPSTKSKHISTSYRLVSSYTVYTSNIQT